MIDLKNITKSILNICTTIKEKHYSVDLHIGKNYETRIEVDGKYIDPASEEGVKILKKYNRLSQKLEEHFDNMEKNMDDIADIFDE